MRQALFEEFQQIEWQARVEAIRERLDEQRRESRVQEEEQERADREAAAQTEADRQVLIDKRKARMAPGLQWHGDRLLPGEHNTNQVAQQVVSEVDLATRARAADDQTKLHIKLHLKLI